jgi:outer membrane protein OmpA-like peptidoglycan-associated protein
MDGDSPIMTVSPEQIRQVFGAAMGARPALPEHFYLYFESGGLRLTAESEALIPTILQKAEDRESAHISVIGHTDTVGRAEANAKLAFQRATNIASMLRGRGLQSATLTIESHGESNLLVPTPDETAEAKNRRVEINIR